MHAKLSEEIATLAQMSGVALRERYAELFGDTTQVGNRAWLVRRIAWRLQAQAEGGLSERARRRAAELANEADLRYNPPPAQNTSPSRLPPPGSVLTRPYKGHTLQVIVRPRGFEYQGTLYPSLSAVAKAITGSHCNGYLFFRLPKAREAL